MPTKKSPRKGSLQFWPRKRARKFLPSVNWNIVSDSKGFKGFVAYKAGMTSVQVRDNTPNSLTKGKDIILPVTILECPKMKIFSVRFYKNGKVIKEVLAKNLDKELKRKIKIPKKGSGNIENVKDYDDIGVIVYTLVKNAGIKKTPDLSEIGISGNLENKINFVKENLDREISVLNVFDKGQLIDIRGLTKGKGFSGPVKRFGITLKQHRSEKGRRRPGSIGPWHPARVTFRVPMAGQMGMFTRIAYNSKIIDIGNLNESQIKDKLKGIKNFGDVKTDYILVKGSVQGPAKRQLLITSPLRQTKKQLKKDFELVSVR